MHQEALFHDDITDALAADIIAAGGYKRMAVELWPALKMETAYARLKASLNPDKNEKLGPDEVMLVMREARKHGALATLTYMCRDANCADPVAIEPEDERARLQREYVEAVRQLERLTKKITAV